MATTYSDRKFDRLLARLNDAQQALETSTDPAQVQRLEARVQRLLAKVR